MKSKGCLNCSQGHWCATHPNGDGEAWCCGACLEAGRVLPGHFVCEYSEYTVESNNKSTDVDYTRLAI